VSLGRVPGCRRGRGWQTARHWQQQQQQQQPPQHWNPARLEPTCWLPLPRACPTTPACRCYMVDGGPAGGEAVQWTVYFKEGGVGTFVPYFVRWVSACFGRTAGPGSPPETLEATTRQWLSELRYLGSTDRVLPPCFRRSCAYVRSIASRMQQQQQEQQQQQGPPGGYPAPATGAAAAAGPATAPPPQNFLQTALVDPSGALCLQRSGS
jgi:hypothetical protein